MDRTTAQLKNLPVCDAVSELEPWPENTEDLSSYMPLELENEMECRLGDMGFDLVGDTDADRLGGEPGGVRRGVLDWDGKRRPCDTRGLGATKS